MKQLQRAYVTESMMLKLVGRPVQMPPRELLSKVSPAYSVWQQAPLDASCYTLLSRSFTDEAGCPVSLSTVRQWHRVMGEEMPYVVEHVTVQYLR